MGREGGLRETALWKEGVGVILGWFNLKKCLVDFPTEMLGRQLVTGDMLREVAGQTCRKGATRILTSRVPPREGKQAVGCINKGVCRGTQGKSARQLATADTTQVLLSLYS